MPKIKVLNIEYEDSTIRESVEAVSRFAAQRDSKIVVTPNAEIAENCFKDPKLFEAISGADYVIPDGVGVVLASRIVGTPLKGRVAGFDLATALLPAMCEQGLSLYLFGAKPGVAEKAAEHLKHWYPDLKIAGIHHGYFSSDSEVVEDINRADPDIVFVSLGSPKQEIWMHENKSRLRTGAMIGLGGTIDIFAGTVKRAPLIMIKLNLEWFYRVMKQPTRLKRIMRIPVYFVRALRNRFQGC